MSLPPSVKTDYLKGEFLSKYVSHDTDPSEVRRTRAINKWLATERENEATNDRLLITPEEYNLLPRVAYGDFIDWCREFIRDIIGDSPPIEALIGSFSGGASTSRPRTTSHPAGKYVGEAHTTPSALPWFTLLQDELPVWFREIGISFSSKEVSGNVLFTVPKKTDIDRAACKEPDINMFLQKGVGEYFRSNLRKKARINLNDQSINRSLAQKGSRYGRLCTLDLSSASDSVSSGLVALFLPECWFTLLDDLRSPITVIDGEEHRNHMFSSMGNGFTFELETLLFLTIAKAVAYFRNIRGIISVYGDDIITPAEMAEDLVWVLSFFGFQTNEDKSFWTGPFRESCGGHYYNGVDITPFYLRKPIENVVDVMGIANAFRRWCSIDFTPDTTKVRGREYYNIITEPELEQIWYWLKSLVPEGLWGGEDFSFKYQLVSDDFPEYKIVERSDTKESGQGGYLHWLNATWRRTDLHEGVTTSRISKDSGRLRTVRVRYPTVPQLPAYFLSEVCGVPERRRPSL